MTELSTPKSKLRDAIRAYARSWFSHGGDAECYYLTHTAGIDAMTDGEAFDLRIKMYPSNRFNHCDRPVDNDIYGYTDDPNVHAEFQRDRMGYMARNPWLQEVMADRISAHNPLNIVSFVNDCLAAQADANVMTSHALVQL